MELNFQVSTSPCCDIVCVCVYCVRVVLCVLCVYSALEC